MSHKQPRWVHLDDLELFLRICNCIKKTRQATEKSLGLPEIAKLLDKPLSALSQCLQRLENRYRCGKLIERTPRVGVGEVTSPGKRLYREAKKLLRRLRDIEQPGILRRSLMEPVRISVGATAATRLNVCFGPVAAFQLWWRAHDRRELQVLIEEGDYTDIIDSIRYGYDPYDFGIGWELQEGAFEDIDQSMVLLDDVEMIALFPNRKLLNLPRHAQINGLLDRYDKDSLVPFDEMRTLFVGRPVATLRTEYYPELAKLHGLIDATRQLAVNTYEDILGYVRMGLADVGCVPEWSKFRQYVEYRRIANDKGSPLTRRVVVYRHKKASQAPPVEKKHVDEFLDALQAFIHEHKAMILRKGARDEVTPCMVDDWVRQRLEKQPVSTPTSSTQPGNLT